MLMYVVVCCCVYEGCPCGIINDNNYCLHCGFSSSKEQAALVQVVHSESWRLMPVTAVQTIDMAVALRSADPSLHTVLHPLQPPRVDRHLRLRHASVASTGTRRARRDRQMIAHNSRNHHHSIPRNCSTKVCALWHKKPTVGTV